VQDEASFSLYPPDRPLPDWTFTLHVPVPRDGERLPTFAINIPGYEPYTVHLDPTEQGAYGSLPYRLNIDRTHKQIDVKEIVMKEKLSAQSVHAPNRGR
jgi:hypothetical protein